jgi:V/A-type H+/Na+-transporting ATPase subunit E
MWSAKYWELKFNGGINMSTKNGISAIANDVLGDVQKEAEAIILAAEGEAKATLKGAKEQADLNYKTIIAQAKSKAEAEKRKISSITEVEMRNRLLQTKEDLVEATFGKSLVKLRAFVETDNYHKYFFKIVQNAAEKIGQKNLAIQVNARDKEWLTPDVLNRLSKKLHCELKIFEKTGNYLGGCIIQTEDGKIIFDVTLDNRLQELKSVLRVELSKTLFGEVS